MRYLYGDSTPSPLQSNYLAFFRDAMEFCVHLLLAQERIKILHNERRGIDEYAEAERTRIGGLRALVLEASEAANTSGPESWSQRAVTRVADAAERAIDKTLVELEAKLAADRAGLAAMESEERDGCLDAFGKWIALHEPHEGEWRLKAQLDDTGRVQGETSGSAPYGAKWQYAIELQADHPMVNGSRVGEFVTQIELALPEDKGWLKKNTKLRLQRIDQYSIDAFATDGTECSYALRTAPRGPTGLDVAIRGDEVKVTLVGAKEAAAVEVNEDNRQRLLTLRDRILEALTTHAAVHRRVVTATLDTEPLAGGEDLGQVVKRLIDAATPIVTQIRLHSLSPNELVIRRLLGNDRREEIFVSTASLLEKLGRLPRSLRAMFAPLGLEWQRARTPIPGEIFVEPPRDVPADAKAEAANPVADESKPADVSKPAAGDSKPAAAEASSDAVPQADSDPEVDVEVVEVPLDPAGPPPIPKAAKAKVEEPASSIEAALQSASGTNGDGERTSSPRMTRETKSPFAIDARSKEALATTVKKIVAAAREGRTLEVYEAYAALFEDSGFVAQRPQDQRQVLKLMVMSKTPPQPSEPVILAYRNALARLEVLAAESSEGIDTEMIAICQKMLS